MIKALSAVAVAALVAAALTVLPGFAPQVAASTPQALAKGDRLAHRRCRKASENNRCDISYGLGRGVNGGSPLAKRRDGVRVRIEHMQMGVAPK